MTADHTPEASSPLPAPSEDLAALIEEAEEFTNETVGYAFKSDWDHDQAVPLIRRLSAALAAALAARSLPESQGSAKSSQTPLPETEEWEVVTLCGSTKFKDAINAENSRLTQEGHVVISLGVFGHTDLPDYDWDTDATDLKAKLDRMHFQKIRMADRVHVVNVGGYYGESTAREIAYARSIGKPVTFMEPVPSADLTEEGDRA